MLAVEEFTIDQVSLTLDRDEFVKVAIGLGCNPGDRDFFAFHPFGGDVTKLRNAGSLRMIAIASKKAGFRAIKVGFAFICRSHISKIVGIRR